MTTRPNILIIMTDQQRADWIGYVRKEFDTPNLDALAERGTIFDNAYSGSTTCVPARASLMTGLLHHRVPRVEDGLALKDGYFTIARALAAAGYETALFGKLHSWPIEARHGFEVMRRCEHLTPSAGYPPGTTDDYHRWLDSNGKVRPRTWRKELGGAPRGSAEWLRAKPFPHERQFHPTSWITREAIQFLQNRDCSKPYLAQVSYLHPHTPYDPPEPYASLYDPDKEVLPASPIEINDALPKWLRDPFYDVAKPGSFGPRRLKEMQPGAVQVALAYVRALIKQIDDAVGELMTHVDLSQTLVIFTSDHGDFGGHRGLISKIPWIPFDDLAKVPFFCAGQGVREGQRVTEPVQSFDLALTILELAGVPHDPLIFDGMSLIPELSGQRNNPLRLVYSATTLGWPMLRCGRLKYIENPWLGEHVVFDLEDDPDETKDVAKKHPDQIATFRELLKKKMRQRIPGLTATLS